MGKTVIANYETNRTDSLTNSGMVHGWLSLFVWVGMLGGAIVSAYRCLAAIEAESTILEALIEIGYGAFFVIVAVMGVKAFRNREPNAIAIGKTYIAMIVIDAILALIMMVVDSDYTSIGEVVKSIIWADIWFSYLTYSEEVKSLFPTETREWRDPEKKILKTFSIAVAILTALAVLP